MARILMLTASMGSGHDGVAGELARRLRSSGVQVTVVDLLNLYPFRLGAALRLAYLAMVRGAPWIYGLIYRLFFVPGHRQGPVRSSRHRSNSDRPNPRPSNHRPSNHCGPGPHGTAGPPAGRCATSRASRVSLAVLLALPGLRRTVRRLRPDAVVSTYHLAGQVAARLRERGELPVPSIVVVTEGR